MAARRSTAATMHTPVGEGEMAYGPPPRPCSPASDHDELSERDNYTNRYFTLHLLLTHSLSLSVFTSRTILAVVAFSIPPAVAKDGSESELL